MKSLKKALFYSFLGIFFLKAGLVFGAGTALYFTKPGRSISVGDRISVSVNVKSPDQSINAVSGSVAFPEDMLKLVSVSKEGTILSVWTHDPIALRNRVSFEGIILNPGYIGQKGTITTLVFEAKKAGTAPISFSEGTILANDGQGTNILTSLDSTSITILNIQAPENAVMLSPIALLPSRRMMLPIITEYSPAVLSKDSIYVKGIGEPNALTKISFKNNSLKSLGERFIDSLQSKKKKLDDVLVKNDAKGSFEYVSASNLLAGAYNATPYLVDDDKNVEKPGVGVQVLVNDSPVVRYLVILINVLGLLIPIVVLVVIIYFIPWYSRLRMKVLKKKINLEEEKIELSEQEIKKEERLLEVAPKDQHFHKKSL